MFDVFDESNRFLGKVTIPANVWRFAVGAAMLAAIVRDDLDVETLVVWRISER